MYYDLDKISLEKYDDGQLLYYTPSSDIWSDKPYIIIVEKTLSYSAKIAGLPTKTSKNNHYINGVVNDEEVKPISEETHPEIFVKLGFRI